MKEKNYFIEKKFENSIRIEKSNDDPFEVEIIKVDDQLNEKSLKIKNVKLLRIFNDNTIRIRDINDFSLNYSLEKNYDKITPSIEKIILYNW